MAADVFVSYSRRDQEREQAWLDRLQAAGISVWIDVRGIHGAALWGQEIVAAIEIPVPPAGHGYAYEKLKRKIGDYATAAAGVVLTVAGGRIATCAIALSNLADAPLLARDAAAAVIGSALEKPAVDAAVKAARAIMSPAADTRGSTEYRTYAGGVMVERALRQAFARAR